MNMDAAPVAAGFADGAWIWGTFLIVAFFGLVYAYFTETGSGIRFRAWSSHEGGAPGAIGYGNAAGKDPAADVRIWTRGTSARRRKHVAVARSADELERDGDVEMLSKLSTWRSRMSASHAGLRDPVDPEVDHVVGPGDAPVTLVKYTDFECPSCQAAAQVVKRLTRTCGRDVRYVLRHFPVVDSHLTALEAAEAVEAAGAQGRFWEMVDRIYANRRPPTSDDLRRHARKLGLDMERFEADLAEHSHRDRVRRDFNSGLSAGVNGTPTFFVNGARHDGDHDHDELLAAVRAAQGEETPGRQAGG